MTPSTTTPTPGGAGPAGHAAASRRRFLSLLGGGGSSALALLLTGCGDGGTSATSAAPVPSASATTLSAAPPDASGDLRILNFALLLEHVGADFYEQVLASGAVKERRASELFKRISVNEHEHVQTLTGTVKRLGGTPVAKPRTRFDAVLAGGERRILMTSAMLENLDAAAYLGQAPSIQSRDVLAAALAIHSVEGRHAAAVNRLLSPGFRSDRALLGAIPDGPFAEPLTMAEVLARTRPFLA